MRHLRGKIKSFFIGHKAKRQSSMRSVAFLPSLSFSLPLFTRSSLIVFFVSSIQTSSKTFHQREEEYQNHFSNRRYVCIHISLSLYTKYYILLFINKRD